MFYYDNSSSLSHHPCPIGKEAAQTKSAWAAFWIVLLVLAVASGAAYLIYKYRIRVSMLPALLYNPCFFMI